MNVANPLILLFHNSPSPPPSILIPPLKSLGRFAIEENQLSVFATTSIFFIFFISLIKSKSFLSLGSGLISGKDHPNIWSWAIRNKNFLQTLQTWTNSISPFHQKKDWCLNDKLRLNSLMRAKQNVDLAIWSWNRTLSVYSKPRIKSLLTLMCNSFSEPKRPSNDD